MLEAQVFTQFVGKGLDDLDAGEGFLQDHVDPGQLDLHLAAVFAHLLAEPDDGVQGHGHDHQGPEGEVGVQVDDRADERRQGEYLAHEHDHAGQTLANGDHVVDDAAHEHADLALREKGQGQPHDLAEQVPAHVPQDQDAGGVHDEDLAELEDALEHDQSGQPEHAQLEGAQVLGHEHVVRDVFGQPGQCRGNGRIEQHGQDGEGHAQLVRGKVADAPLEHVDVPHVMKVRISGQGFSLLVAGRKVVRRQALFKCSGRFRKGKGLLSAPFWKRLGK